MQLKSKYYLKQSLEEAETKARLRSINHENNLNEIVKEVAKQEKIANELGYGLYKRKRKNRTSFTQSIEENIGVLLKKKYITTSELGLLSGLNQFLAFGTNALKNKQGNFITISEIAEEVSISRENVSRTIKKLIEKGLLYENVPIQEIKKYNRNVNARPLYMNPEIMYKGDKNEVPPGIADYVLQYDYLEKNKIYLPKKVWKSNNEKFGRIVDRSTYLKLKAEMKKTTRNHSLKV